MSLPSAKVAPDLAFENSEDSMTSRRKTVSTFLLGTSMPTANFSGMFETRTEGAPMERAMSFERFEILAILMPLPSWIS